MCRSNQHVDEAIIEFDVVADGTGRADPLHFPDGARCCHTLAAPHLLALERNRASLMVPCIVSSTSPSSPKPMLSVGVQGKAGSTLARVVTSCSTKAMCGLFHDDLIGALHARQGQEAHKSIPATKTWCNATIRLLWHLLHVRSASSRPSVSNMLEEHLLGEVVSVMLI